jgi:hypothetical protein
MFIRKEIVCGLMEILSRNLPVATEENHEKPQVTIANVPGEILTKHTPNTSQEHHRYINPFRPDTSKSKFDN